jgi:Zn-dependent protease with chaperone function/uncharacterized RDD family membrane protein YckC
MTVREPPAAGTRYPWRAAPGPAPTSRQVRPPIRGRRAGLVTRVLANVLDVVVVLLLLAGGYAAVAAGRFLINPPAFRFPAPGFGLVLIAGLALQAVYFTASWRVTGRTYGDAVLGLRVVNFRGERMHWAGAAVRALFCVVFPIGLLWVLLSPRNRSVQDAVLRTSVIYDWPSAGSRPAGRECFMTASTGTRRGAGLRHPAEVPFYVFMVVLNLAIIALIIRFAFVLPFVPPRLQDAGWAVAIRAALVGLLLLVPGLVVGRELQRATTRGTAVQLSRSQYPGLYETAERFAAAIGLRRMPQLYLANGNGTLNAFAAQATGFDYVVVSNELFVNLREQNRDGLNFILGHEMGHVRLHHVALWYQLSIAYSGLIPVLGPTLSRLREYSCDRHGAYLSPGGVTGLVLLASGRYTEHDVDVAQLLQQGRELRGFWVGLAQLPRSHPFTVRRVERLFRAGLFTRIPEPVGAGAVLPRPPMDAATTQAGSRPR